MNDSALKAIADHGLEILSGVSWRCYILGVTLTLDITRYTILWV